MEIRQLSAGAEVLGLDCSKDIPADTQARIYAAWLEHGFLVFRQPVRTPADQMRLSRVFGELEIHPVRESWVDGEPYLTQIGGSNREHVVVADGEVLTDLLAWHRDSAYLLEVCKGSGLRLLEKPPEGGETLFADTAAAYDDLPEAMKRRLEGLECKATLRHHGCDTTRGVSWKSLRPATRDEWPQASTPALTPEVVAMYPPVVHPVVIIHPESGRRCLYISPLAVESILGLSDAESSDILDELVEHMIQGKYIYAHTWEVHETIIWDNRRCIHRTTGYHPKYMRSGQRTTLSGSLRSGRYFDPADAVGRGGHLPGMM